MKKNECSRDAKPVLADGLPEAQVQGMMDGMAYAAAGALVSTHPPEQAEGGQ